jgi:hypothetical protein
MNRSIQSALHGISQRDQSEKLLSNSLHYSEMSLYTSYQVNVYYRVHMKLELVDEQTMYD